MSNLELNEIRSGYNLGKINVNFAQVQDKVNNGVLHTSGGKNVMGQAIDMNGWPILNISVDLSEPGSLLSLGVADDRYINVDGDTMTGALHVQTPLTSTEAARKDQIDYLQNQINGGIPLEASAFSPISWHKNNIDASVNIPEDVNAWSFGPSISIQPGVDVVIGDGSFWTIANGGVQ